jgi:ceramide glucosyltransferase
MAWLIVTYSLLASGVALLLALRLARAFTSPEAPGPLPAGADSLSILVPIKGADSDTPDLLRHLVDSDLPGAAEFIFSMESEDDPAFEVCRRLQTTHRDRDIKITISGEPRGLIGKQHNLAHAYGKSTGDIIVCMDSDIQVEPDTVKAGLPYLNREDVGSAFFLPAYQGGVPVGGRLVETYLNYQYNLFMGALATLTKVPYIFGGLWMTKRTDLEQTGGFESFGRTVSDDAAIGRAFREQGQENVLIPRTVGTPNEKLGLISGMKHLGKWVGMLRAEGLVPYFTIWIWWHPVFWAAILVIIGLTLDLLHSDGAVYAAVGIGLSLAAKTAAGMVLNLRVYRRDLLTSFLALVVYELIAVPVLYGVGIFRRSITWKGRKYRIGRRGMVLGPADSG